MYNIGRLWEPEEGETIWTLDIDFDCEDNPRKVSHGAIVIVHGESPAHCMLKAGYICELLNSEGMYVADNLVSMMELSKVNQPLM